MENDQENINNDYLSALQKHADNLRTIKMYSVQRIDLLIISISSAGIYCCFELIKYISTDDFLSTYACSITTPYKVAGVFFTITIVVNFISQWSAYKGSSYALNSTTTEIYAIKNGGDVNGTIDKLDNISGLYNKVTNISNMVSVFFLFLSLICLMTSICHLF